MTLPIGWFSTGRGEGSRPLLTSAVDAIRHRELDPHIPLVFCNPERGEPLPAWRIEYDRQVADLIAPYPFDIGVLAGYMLVFTGEVCNRYPLLNLHPAEPRGPVGTWQEVTWQLIDQRAGHSGVMIPLATA